MSQPPRSLYVHVPFCRHKCGYCDFTLVAGQDGLIDRYLAALRVELSHRREVWRARYQVERLSLQTLFLGGGTPTHPSPTQLQHLFDTLHEFVELEPDAEVSTEANPLDLTDEKLALLQRAGVNRLSIGVQSFDATALRLLERDHTPAEVIAGAERWRGAIPNWSLDLIFGVPGQTLDQWQETLAQAVELKPTHVSTYGLTFEPGTAFETRRSRGELHPVMEELERSQYALAMDWLPTQCYAQYEISSFAQPGWQCRHNHIYWNGDPFEAVGPGAARYLEGTRETNLRSVHGWLQRLERGEDSTHEREHLDHPASARELVFIGLRRVRGIARDEFQTRSGIPLDEVLGSDLASFVEQGLMSDDGQRVAFTQEGRFVADAILATFL